MLKKSSIIVRLGFVNEQRAVKRDARKEQWTHTKHTHTHIQKAGSACVSAPHSAYWRRSLFLMTGIFYMVVVALVALVIFVLQWGPGANGVERRGTFWSS